MEKPDSSSNEKLREWIKLRLGIDNLSEAMGKTRGTIHNWLKQDLKEDRLKLIFGTALSMGVQPSEIKEIMAGMGIANEQHEFNTSYDNIKDSTIISGNISSPISGVQHGNIKGVRPPVYNLEYYKTELQKLREENEIIRIELKELQLNEARLEGMIEILKEMLKDRGSNIPPEIKEG